MCGKGSEWELLCRWRNGQESRCHRIGELPGEFLYIKCQCLESTYLTRISGGGTGASVVFKSSQVMPIRCASGVENHCLKLSAVGNRA